MQKLYDTGNEDITQEEVEQHFVQMRWDLDGGEGLFNSHLDQISNQLEKNNGLLNGT
jgi:hypothetical protein